MKIHVARVSRRRTSPWSNARPIREEFFGEERLAQIVQENSHLPLPRISEAILSAVTDWIGGEEQPDDMTIVLARAR